MVSMHDMSAGQLKE